MAIVQGLCGFAVRQLVEGACSTVGISGGGEAVGFLTQRFTDHSKKLTDALENANERAWKALEIALAGESFWDRCKVVLSSGDDKAFGRQVRAFLDANPPSTDGAEFRDQCLRELRTARNKKLLTGGGLDPKALAEQAGAFARFADPQAVLAAEWQAVDRMAQELEQAGHPGLGQLLSARPPQGLPLLVVAVRYFFRRQVETDPQLYQGLAFAQLERLGQGQDAGFAALDAALTQQGQRLESLLGEIQSVVVETHGAVLDLQDQIEGQGEQVRQIGQAVQKLLEQHQLQRRELRPGDSLSIRNDGERQLVKQLVARYRAFPEGDRKGVPALLNAVGKLEVVAGDFDAAQKDFQAVALLEQNDKGKAEAHYNAYLASLEKRDWPGAIQELVKAIKLDGKRFAPFPVGRYLPVRILGAGGFGVAFLCKHRYMDAQMVVKTLALEDLGRDADKVFTEAQVLRQLEHAAIIRISECGYVDAAKKSRPYILMDYFQGGTLEEHVKKHGPLAVEDLIAVARQVADGLQAAHTKGILHRDVKPANLLVHKDDKGWKVKVIDFGLALRQKVVQKSTSASTARQSKTLIGESIAGTVDYAAPEQMGKREGVAPGPYSDVYGWAKTCCYALFQTPQPLMKHWQSIPTPLAELLEKCLDEDPAKRPHGFADVLAALDTTTANPAKGTSPARPAVETTSAFEEAVDETPKRRKRRRAAAKPMGPAWRLLERVRRVAMAAARAAAKPMGPAWRLPLMIGGATALAAVLVVVLLPTVELLTVVLRKTPLPPPEDPVATQPKPPEKTTDSDPKTPLPPPEDPVATQPKPPATDGPGPIPADLPPPLTNTIGMKLQLIRPGKFLMGSPKDEDGRSDKEGPQHEVEITKAFYVGACPVTKGQFAAFVKDDGYSTEAETDIKNTDGYSWRNPAFASYNQTDNDPVVYVSWNDAVKFCAWLSRKEKKTYELPTEAEWEYACRAATTTAFSFADPKDLGDYAWYSENSGGHTHPVGEKKPNPWGIYDMHGNVCQWCADGYGPYDENDIKDPKGNESANNRVMRGGSEVSFPYDCRSAYRWVVYVPGNRSVYSGFRVVLRVPAGAPSPKDPVATQPKPPAADLPPPLTNTIGMKLQLIRAGKFLMGSPKDEDGRSDKEGPQHEVEITKAFYMGACPVTKGQFAAFVKDDGYQTEAENPGDSSTWRNPHFNQYDQTDNDPVVYVSWNDAVKFCAWLSGKEKKTYELPTEAEWEYACRAGTTTAFSFQDPKDLGNYAWYYNNSAGHTQPVGGKKPNGWGLYDMHGNVWQWCADGYSPYDEKDIKDPKGKESTISRVFRGGSFNNPPPYCRSAFRDNARGPAGRTFNNGFRVVLRPSARTPSPEDPVATQPKPPATDGPGPIPADLPSPLTNTIGMKLQLIRPGRFLMGSPKDEEGRFDEGPQHEVEITKAFYVGACPVTKGQFAAFAKDDGYSTEAEKANEKETWRNPHFVGKYDQTDNDPVVEMSWNDAVKFCAWLSKKEGKTYELPTEAEWEYACRAGTTTAFSFPDPKGLGDYAWYDANSGGHTHPVGEKKPNPWGLYDMHGNVWQWCADGYGPYPYDVKDIKDPKDKESTNSRVLRGGSFNNLPRYCRSADRQDGDPGDRSYVLGFRVVLRVPARTP